MKKWVLHNRLANNIDIFRRDSFSILQSMLVFVLH
jgi:hypothetical protein